MQTNPTLLFVENIPRGLKKIRKSLESIENIDIIDKDVNSGQIALQTIREFMPDVVLLERKLPDMDGVKLTEIIRREFIGVQVVLLSKDTRAEVVRKAMRSGACEFLSHNTTFEELESAIKWAAELADRDYQTPGRENYHCLQPQRWGWCQHGRSKPCHGIERRGHQSGVDRC
jgi:DNA-binding NarL/FixJ family response regulator